MNIFIKFSLLAIVGVILRHFGILAFIYLSYGNDVIKHYPGKCQLVKGFTTNGSEDMTLLPSGKLIITSGIRMPGMQGFDPLKEIAKGEIYVMDTNNDTNSVSKLIVNGWPADTHFVPHGIDNWVHKNGSVSLFMILHLPERVGRFLYDGDKILTLTKIYENPTFMRNINSVVAMSEDSFYATNIFYTRVGDELASFIEMIMYNRPQGFVIYAKGDNYIDAAGGFIMPNGITADMSYVYLATNGAVRIFTKNTDNTLEPFKTISIGIGSIDNIKLDSSGDLWLGCQNRVKDVAEYFTNPEETKCHSTILRIHDPTGAAEIEEVFTDDSSFIKAASVGVYTNRKLLIGTIIDKMLSCDVNYLSGM